MSYQFPDNFKPQNVQKCNTFKPSVCSGDAYQCLDLSNNNGNVCNYYPFLCLQDKPSDNKFVKPNYSTACVKKLYMHKEVNIIKQLKQEVWEHLSVGNQFQILMLNKLHKIFLVSFK